MTTTPTLWGTDVTFSFDPFAFNPKVAALSDGTFAIAWENGSDLFGRHLNELGSFTGGNFLQTLSGNHDQSHQRPADLRAGRRPLGRRIPAAVLAYRHRHPLAFRRHQQLPALAATRSRSRTPPSTSSCSTPRRLPRAARRSPISMPPRAVRTSSSDLSTLSATRRAIGSSSTRAATRTELNPALAKLGISGNVMVAYESFHNTDLRRATSACTPTLPTAPTCPAR